MKSRCAAGRSVNTQNIQRVTVTANAFTPSSRLAEFSDRNAAESVRNEAVGRGTHAGETLRPIHAKVSGGLIEFVLHRIRRNDFDVSIDHCGRVRPLARLRATGALEKVLRVDRVTLRRLPP